MKIIINSKNNKYELDLEKKHDISIPFNFNGPQPNFCEVKNASVKPLITDNKIWSVSKDAPCNVPEISLNIHCNGTHTETVGHLLSKNIDIGEIIKDIFVPVILITIKPEIYKREIETYHKVINENELVITSKAIKNRIKNNFNSNIKGIVIRTLPNKTNKKTFQYPEDKYPFFTNKALAYLNYLNIKHLFVDIPSIDRYDDDGILGNHRLFWGDGININSKLNNNSDKTITEFCYIDNKINDGFYFINLQIPHFILDSAPSRPILIKAREIKH